MDSSLSPSPGTGRGAAGGFMGAVRVLHVLLKLGLALFLTLVFGTPAMLGAVVDRSGRFSRKMGQFWGRSILRTIGIRVFARGIENVPSGPAVYAANHSSAIDILLLYGYLPIQFRIIHKRSLYLVPIIGQYLYFAGHIGIDRSKPFQARRGLAAAVAKIRAGANVASFPEGTRNPGWGVRHFKRGSFGLAIDAGVPVVPVSFGGVRACLPHGLPWVVPGRVDVVIHPPVPTTGLKSEDAAALAERVREIVAGECQGPA